MMQPDSVIAGGVSKAGMEVILHIICIFWVGGAELTLTRKMILIFSITDCTERYMCRIRK